jgi:hypothetical protein
MGKIPRVRLTFHRNFSIVDKIGYRSRSKAVQDLVRTFANGHICSQVLKAQESQCARDNGFFQSARQVLSIYKPLYSKHSQMYDL